MKSTEEIKSRKKGKEELYVASQWQLIRWKFYRHKMAMASLVVLGIFYLSAIFTEFVSPYDPFVFDQDHLHAPPQRLYFLEEGGRFHLRPFVYGVGRKTDPETLEIIYTEDRTERYSIGFFIHGDPYKLWGLFRTDLHLFGFEDNRRVFLIGGDKLGRDMLSRVIYGSRISLSIGLLGVGVSFLLGITIGGASGYYGGRVDLVIQRVIEFLISIPTLPLWMGLSAALPLKWSVTKTYFAIAMILSIVGWTGLARVVRGKFMALREEDFIMAAELYGASKGRLIFRYLLPSFYSYVIASLTLSVPGMILGETALSFIGLGMQAPAISWGVLLKEAQHIRVLADAPWILIPGLFVIVSILSFNFVGDGLRDAADPYSTV